MVTQERLKQLFIYDEDSGVFISKYLNRPVGITTSTGYVRIKVDGKWRRAHRMAWLYSFGEEPKEIDHINQVKSDNRLCNLRSVSHAENMKNLPLKATNKTGIAGVIFSKGKWEARIQLNGKQYYLGRHCDFFGRCCSTKERRK